MFAFSVLRRFSQTYPDNIVVIVIYKLINKIDLPLRRASFPRSKAVRRGFATWTRGSGAGAGAEEAGGVRRKHTAMHSIRATDYNEK